MKYRALQFGAAVWLMLTAVFAARAAPSFIEPFKATYAVTYRGLRAGNIIFELTRDANGQYVYHSVVQPSMLARMIISPQATEMTRFALTEDGVHPLEWKLDDGESGSEQDGKVTFDVGTQRAQGVIKDKKVDFPLEPHLQDRLSVQMEVIHLLLEGAEPGEIPLVDDERIKRYNYKRTKTEPLKTPVGEFSTIVYESTRPGSKRISRMWHAPALGYIPIRAEQVRDGKVETTMHLVALQGRSVASSR
ncbi:MAG: DUF3108 domain-containing protein [Steroidobacteraceae bacterium]